MGTHTTLPNGQRNVRIEYIHKLKEMKKAILSLAAIAMISVSCTENSRVKNWCGEGKISLPKGRKLINVTWKETQIWYLTRPMTSTDSVETYKFQEESSWGVVEGTYTITESK